MKAVLKTKKEPGIEIHDVPSPILPKYFPSGEVIVQVGACGICGTDVEIFHWKDWISRYVELPRIIGHEVAGTIVEIGKDCGGWRIGDRVVADTYLGCGGCFFCRIGRFNLCENRRSLGTAIDGGMAEFVAISVKNLFPLPESISFEVGAVIEPLGVAVHAYEQSGFQPGDSVLILGPGPIGLGILMTAKAAGSTKIFVTGLGRDEARLKKARELGADAAINVEESDLTQRVLQGTRGKGADVAFVCTGSGQVLMQAAQLVRKGGTVVVLGLFEAEALFPASLLVEKELTFKGSWRRDPISWYRSIDLVTSGVVPLGKIISHVIALEEIERGFRAIDEGEALKVVVSPSSGG
jgi:2-desacetyl-2-hydroxyethyl bacteriochlorophyllide A dehydrogenase